MPALMRHMSLLMSCLGCFAVLTSLPCLPGLRPRDFTYPPALGSVWRRPLTLQPLPTSPARALDFASPSPCSGNPGPAPGPAAPARLQSPLGRGGLATVCAVQQEFLQRRGSGVQAPVLMQKGQQAGRSQTAGARLQNERARVRQAENRSRGPAAETGCRTGPGWRRL